MTLKLWEEDKQNWETTSQTHPEKEKDQISKIRNEKEEVATDNTEIQRVIREYYQQLYASKMGNLEKTDRFLEKFKPPMTE